MSEPLDPEENVLEGKLEGSFLEENNGVAMLLPLLPSPRLISRKHMNSELRTKIEQAINECSAENVSNTPDFILAQYLIDCLSAFDKAVLARESYYDPGDEEIASFDLPVVENND
ncbi:MAG TPA: hypothetical protein V6C65_04445 [Allocoleopsis sp.]